MARTDLVSMDGVIKDVLDDGSFRVEVAGGHTIVAQLAGGMRRSGIRLVLGDSVTLSVSQFDPTRGLITCRADK